MGKTNGTEIQVSFYPWVFCQFSGAVIRYPDKNHLGEDGLILAHSSEGTLSIINVGKAWWASSREQAGSRAGP